MLFNIKNLILNFIPSSILLKKGNNNKSSIAITLDDGPNRENMQNILNLLKNKNIKATFFFTGKNVSLNPNLVKAAFEQGHEIGNHFYHHKSCKKMSLKQLSKEINNTEIILKEIISKPVKLLRPPYGHLSISLLYYAIRNNKTIVLWSKDPKETKYGNVIRTKNYFEKSQLSNGDIILLHEDSEYILESINHIISLANEYKKDFHLISELLI